MDDTDQELYLKCLWHNKWDSYDRINTGLVLMESCIHAWPFCT